MRDFLQLLSLVSSLAGLSGIGTYLSNVVRRTVRRRRFIRRYRALIQQGQGG